MSAANVCGGGWGLEGGKGGEGNRRAWGREMGRTREQPRLRWGAQPDATGPRLSPLGSLSNFCGPGF